MDKHSPVWQDGEMIPCWETGGREEFAQICYEGATDTCKERSERRMWGKLLRYILPDCNAAYLSQKSSQQ